MDFEQRLDPQLQAALAVMPALGSSLTEDIALHRTAFLEMARAHAQPPLESITIENRYIPGPEGAPEVFVRIYTPKQRPATLPGVLWIHGGGFIIGHPVMDDDLCQRFVNEAECIIVSVDWRLAPENPFPAGVEDCYAALQWMVASAAELGIDPDHVAVAGASAGGGVTAAVALLARDRGGPKLAFQMPLCACLDDRHTTPSSYEVTDPRLWNRGISLAAWKLYLAGETSGKVSPYAAPSRATDLSSLPPAYMCIGEVDLMRDENIEYATRLMQAGANTELHIYPGAFHGFEQFASTAAISQRALSEYADALKRGLHRQE